MVIEVRNNKKKVIFWNRLKKLNFENIENELDFHGYGTAKIEIQQQPDDITPSMSELHKISYRFYNSLFCDTINMCAINLFVFSKPCSQGLLAF